jgi:hypothetical protein
MDSRETVNRALEEMGEPPLGPNDIVQSEFVESPQPADGPKIKLLEPPGYRRSHLFFMNGRQVDLNLQVEELRDLVRDFQAHAERDFLELPHIEAVGDQKEGSVVIVSNPTFFSHRALELLQSIGVSWMKRVPGEEMSAPGKVAVVRGDEAKSVIVNMNREQRRRLQRENGRG